MAIEMDEDSRRTIEDLIAHVESRSPISPEIILHGKVIRFWPFSMGKTEPAEDLLHMIFCEVVGEKATPIGVLRMTRAQWEEMKEHAEGHLSLLEEARTESKQQ